MNISCGGPPQDDLRAGVPCARRVSARQFVLALRQPLLRQEHGQERHALAQVQAQEDLQRHGQDQRGQQVLGLVPAQMPLVI